MERKSCMTRFLTHLLIAGAAWGIFTAAAHADPSWTYTTKATPLAIAPDSPGGGLILTSQSTESAVTTGKSGIVATTVLGTIAIGNDHYTQAGYQVDITVNDKGSGQSHTFSFNGQFTGDFSATKGAQLVHELIDPVTHVATSSSTVSESFVIGGNTYMVTIDPHVIVGALGSFPASIGGFVEVVGGDGSSSNGGDNTHVATAPEPSAMVLSMLGVSVLGVAAVRRRLRRQNG
jgi:hypothetical protein